MKQAARNRTKRLIRIAYFTALTAVGAFIKIPAGTIVFSMQSFFVILSGLIVGAVDGFAAQAAYMAIGLVGVPIFTQGGGPSYVLQPSFGYILGFCLGAFVTGTVMKLPGRRGVARVWLAGVAGLVPMYAVGIAYQVMILVCVTRMELAAAAATLVTMPLFLLFDVVAVFITALAYPRIARAVGSFGAERRGSAEVGNGSDPSDGSLNGGAGERPEAATEEGSATDDGEGGLRDRRASR